MYDNIPHNARNCLRILYQADNGKKGEYTIYSVDLPHGVTKWCWQALGNNGEEESAYEATSAARDWIRNGVKARQVGG